MSSHPSTRTGHVARFVEPANVLVVACAVAAAILATMVIRSTPIESVALVGSFGLAFLIAQVMPIQVRAGSRAEFVGFEEAIAVPALLTLAPSTAIVALLLSLPAWQVVARQPARRALFNAAQLVVSFAAAQLVLVAIVGPQPGITRESIFAAVLALGAMFALNQLLVAAMFSLRSGVGFASVIGDDLVTKLAIWAGNVSLGLLLAPSLHEMPDLLPAALLLLVLLHAAVRGYVRAGQGDRAITGLVASAAELGTDVPLSAISHRIAEVAQGIAAGCGAAVHLDPIELAALADGTPPGPDAALRTQVGTTGRLFAVVRLEVDGRRIGELRVWREPSDSGHSRASRRNDLAALEIIARQGATALARAIIEHRSQQHLAMIAQVFEHAHEGLVQLDSDGRVTAWNPAAAQLVGLDDRRMLGAPIECVSPTLAHAIRNGAEGSVTAAVEGAGGTRRIVQASIAAVRTEHGRGAVRSWVVALHDVTRAHEAERLKSDFVATVSHELRTPLTTIRGFLETMRRDDLQLEESQVASFLDIMRAEARRLERLINDLLDTSAIEAGRPPSLRPCAFDLVEEVRRAVVSFRAAHPEVDLAFDEAASCAGLRVVADPDRFQQVLVNLLENARRHGGSALPIELHVLAPRDGRCGVLVRDHGSGIPIEEQARVFDRFYFSPDSVTRTGGGAGLGLYISRHLMNAMGGSIELDSSPGGGTSFELRLPGVVGRRMRRPFGSQPETIETG